MTHPLNRDFITQVLEQNNRDYLDRDNQHNMSVTEIRCECPSCCLSEANKNNIASDSSTNGMSPASQGTQQSIDGILSGYQWNIALGGTITYSFYEDDDFTNSYYGSEKNVKEVSKEVQDSYREIFAWLENVIDVDFVEVDENAPNAFGQIRIMNSDGPSYAYAYYPFSSRDKRSGDIHLNSSYDRFGDTNGFKHDPGKHGYMTLVHELGHALGLAHPHSGTVLPSNLDNTDNSIMSYNFTGQPAATFARLDIVALQHLYGAKEHNTGDTTYVFGEYIDQVSVNGVSLVDTSHRTKQTLWDSGGIDTLDFSNLRSQNSGFHLDLRDGGFLSRSFSGTTNYSTSLAYNVDIENAINSSSNDTIYLNGVANEISGYHENRFTGHDVIHYGSSQDIIRLDYFSHQVTETRSGQDLVLGLGSNGSIRLVNYYGSSNTQIQVVYNDGNLVAPITQSNSSINVTVKGVAYDATVASYGNESINNGNPAPQDIGDAVVTTSEDGNEVQIINNGWKSVDIGDYNLTDNTIITFEFRSDYQGELQGIGLDNNDNVFDSTNALFQLYGTQTFANQAFNNYTYSGDGWQQYSINVGELLGGSGTYDRLVLMNDDDANPLGVSSQFRNISIVEQNNNNITVEDNALTVTVETITQISTLQSYGNDSVFNGNPLPQDTDDAVVITSEDSNEVQIINNGWKSVDIGNYNLTDNTIINFEFRSDYQGELQGIGLDNNDNVFDSTNALFQLYGTQTFANQAFNNYTYSGDGWQQYSINVGELLGGSGTYDRLVFMNDDDANPLGVSSQFRNIVISETPVNHVPSDSITVEIDRTILNLMSQQMGINLTGINQDRPLLGEKGTSGADVFVLGDKSQPYYNKNGYADFTLIEGFNNQQGDSLQLHGEAGLYNVVTVEHRGMSANAIFYQDGNREDLMAIVTGDRIELQSSAVRFV